MNQESDNPSPVPSAKPKNPRLVAVIIVLVLVVGAALYFQGTIPFAYATIKCGHRPITATSFAAAYSYSRPGDPGYGPGPFVDHYYCTELEAIAGGYRGMEGSLSDQQAKELAAQATEKAKFASSKVSFTAHVPNYLPSGYKLSALTIDTYGSGPQVTQELRKDGEPFILLRQDELGSPYAACSLNACTVVGKDSQGRTISRSHSDNNGSTFWGVTFSDSFYNIEVSKHSTISDGEITKIFSSLSPAE